MKVSVKFLMCLSLAVTIIGCTSQENKKKEEPVAVATPSMPKNFERPVPPAVMTDPQDRAAFLITHFWNNFDFRDTMYCHAPDITEQAFVDFIALFPHTPYGKVLEGVRRLLDSAEVDVVMYNYFYTKAEHYLYNPNSPMRNDEYFIPFLEHVVASTKVKEENKVRPRYQLNLAYKNRLGEKASDVMYTLSSGKTGNLYGISAPYILLMFYNPDCTECARTTEMIKNSPVITAAVSSGRLKVVAIYPDENLDAWKKHLQDIPSSWINGYDKSLTVKNKEIYDLKAIPTLYLLDKDKKILLKDTSTGDIHEYLEQHP